VGALGWFRAEDLVSGISTSTARGPEGEYGVQGLGVRTARVLRESMEFRV
jgi:hypothetical protein